MRSSCHQIGRLSRGVLVIGILLITCSVVSNGSEGDRDYYFGQCNLACSADCSMQDAAKSPNERHPWRTWDLWITGWTCPENCRYKCMRQNMAFREHNNLPTVKYYGKWPFRRILGMQELLSVIFSIANFVPHFQYYRKWNELIPESYFMRPLWRLYALSAMNTWVWSAVFHARDTPLTERLDYFCATMSLLFLLVLAIVRILHITSPKGWALVASPFALYYVFHCGYLHLIHFDYGYNMTFSLIIGCLYIFSFTAWALINHRLPYVWKILTANIMALAFAAFEVFDFPPLWGLLDAHAVWHAATPIVSYLTWSFVVDDAYFISGAVYTKLQ